MDALLYASDHPDIPGSIDEGAVLALIRLLVLAISPYNLLI
jgi:hypothetical protein